MATEYTPNYNLDLYASADKPNLRDQYNSAMGKIDTQMKANADGVTNANANVGTLQTQMTKAQGDISALESTVETHGTQITHVQKTADDALSLAQTNESDIADTQSDVTSLTGRVTTVEGTANKNKTDIASLETRMDTAESDIDGLQTSVNGKAPTSHASSSNTYGQGSPSDFGHLKVVDSGTAAASTGTAASPKMVSELSPKIVLRQETTIAGLGVTVTFGGGTVVCSLVKSAAAYDLPSGETTLATIPVGYRPTGDFAMSVFVEQTDTANAYMFVNSAGRVWIVVTGKEMKGVKLTGQIVWNIVARVG